LRTLCAQRPGPQWAKKRPWTDAATQKAAIDRLLTFINDSRRQFRSFAVIGFIHGVIEPDRMAVTSDQLQI
jgi:hypothetical protein